MSSGCLEQLDMVPPVMSCVDARRWGFPTILRYDVYNALSGRTEISICVDFEHTVRDVWYFIENFFERPIQIVHPLPRNMMQLLPTLCAREGVHAIGIAFTS